MHLILVAYVLLRCFIEEGFDFVVLRAFALAWIHRGTLGDLFVAGLDLA